MQAQQIVHHLVSLQRRERAHERVGLSTTGFRRTLMETRVCQYRVDPRAVVARANTVQGTRNWLDRTANAGIGKGMTRRALRLNQDFAAGKVRRRGLHRRGRRGRSRRAWR
jgi:hypothetical protein